ncbi:M1 family metallopeptidase [Luteimicrobium sp. DT211]|uniref:M1 family metallopeptidase n=1 Tax=Luteimicrobium sp. DT211 TaxID=3393412 RepID=UPI003CF9E204
MTIRKTPAGGWPDPYVPGHGSAAYVVTHYGLELVYRVTPNRLEGTATLDVRTLVDVTELRLDLDRLKVTRVQVGGRAARYAQKAGSVVVRLAAPAPAGTELTVQVAYSGNPRPSRGTWGETGWEELTDGVLVAGQPDGAPTWFPCNDHTGYKATLDLTVTVDAPYTVVACSPVQRVTRRSSTRTWVFERTEPLCVYLMTLQVGQYDLAPLGPGAQVARPAALAGRVDADLSRHAELVGVFEDAFGPYPFSSYTLVVTPDPLEIPLEAHAAAVFGSNHLDGHGGADRLVAHELAHQWFGNSVSVGRWQDVWLNEGFACYAEWIWSGASGGSATDAQARAAHDRLARLPQDLVVGDPGPDDMFDDRVYKRGALTLHALRLTVGDDAFFRLLHAWTERHRFGTVATADLRALAAEVCGTDGLEDLFDAWLTRPALPALPR